MNIKFKTFQPVYGGVYGVVVKDTATVLNEWLEENPNVEIISWQTTPVGTTNELYITIQYTEKYPTTAVCYGVCP
jgi:hypothetical protein